MKKLTLISIRFNGRLYSEFLSVQYNKDGRARVDHNSLSQLLDRAGVRPGQTYSLG